MQVTEGSQSVLEDGDRAAVAKDPVTDVAELARQAEAEATAAEEVAAAARARVEALRRAAAAGETAEAGDQNDPVIPDELKSASPRRRRRWLQPMTVLTTLSLVATCAVLATGGYLVWQHQRFDRDQQRRAEFAAGAGQAVVTLMSIDGNNARDDVQRIIDDSTGQFRDDFTSAADEFIGVAKQSKAVTKASVKATAVESMTKDSAVVLVTAATTISNSAGANQQPRTWRLSVDVVDDGGQIKMSKVDFVP